MNHQLPIVNLSSASNNTSKGSWFTAVSRRKSCNVVGQGGLVLLFYVSDLALLSNTGPLLLVCCVRSILLLRLL